MTVQAERHAAEPESREDPLIVVHPLLRLDPPADASGKWTASWLGSRHGVRITGPGVAVLLLASAPVTCAGIVDRLVLRGIAEATAWHLVRGLEQRGLLLQVSSPSYQDAWRLAQESGAWRAAGWRAAAAYHFQTYGYQFETYGRDGSSDEDARRMLGYASTESDVDRGKVSADASSVGLPAPAAGLALFSFLDISAGRVPPVPFGLSAVSGVLSLVALPVQTVPLPWPGARPVVHKTSPSGGSRHPTEFYLRAIDVTGLPAGWYHVSSPTGELCRVRDPGRDDASLTHFFSGLVSHANFVPRAVLVYSCMFRRNRYRYREPRTFRTIHMDVGHLMSTTQAAAAASGLTAAHLPVIRGRALAEHLGLDPLVECPLAASLLGTHYGDAEGSQ